MVLRDVIESEVRRASLGAIWQHFASFPLFLFALLQEEFPWRQCAFNIHPQGELFLLYSGKKNTFMLCGWSFCAESPSFFFCHLSPSLSSVSSSWIKNFLLAFYCSTSGMTRFHPRLSLRSPHSHRTRKMHYTAAKEQKSLESSLWTIAER